MDIVYSITAPDEERRAPPRRGRARWSRLNPRGGDRPAIHPRIDLGADVHALRAGARGYLPKHAGIAEIARAVQAAASQQTLLDPSSTPGCSPGQATGAGEGTRGPAPTPRQSQPR